MPHSGMASNSSLMNRGNSLPVLASVRAMKLTACCCAAQALAEPLKLVTADAMLSRHSEPILMA